VIELCWGRWLYLAEADGGWVCLLQEVSEVCPLAHTAVEDPRSVAVERQSQPPRKKTFNCVGRTGIAGDLAILQKKKSFLSDIIEGENSFIICNTVFLHLLFDTQFFLVAPKCMIKCRYYVSIYKKNKNIYIYSYAI
jgi:hypothetical protein